MSTIRLELEPVHIKPSLPAGGHKSGGRARDHRTFVAEFVRGEAAVEVEFVEDIEDAWNGVVHAWARHVAPTEPFVYRASPSVAFEYSQTDAAV